MREDFGIFTEECFRAFGDRVKYWTTINEALTFTLYGYDLGFHALGHCSPRLGNGTTGNSSTKPLRSYPAGLSDYTKHRYNNPLV